MLNLDKFKKKEEARLKEGKTTLREKESQEKLTQVDYKSPGAFHIEPEYRELIRKQTEDEARNFEESIKIEGVREPVLYWTHTLRDTTGARIVHTVVDGHHRCEAAIKLGLEFIPCKELKFNSHNDVRIWMLRNQLGRRNIGDAEKIRIALQLTEFLGIEAKERKKRQVQGFNEKKNVEVIKEVSEEQNSLDDFKNTLNLDPSGKINRAEEAAKIAGVSTKNVTKMKKVIEKGPSDMLSLVMDGNLSIHKAWTELRSKELEEKKKAQQKKKKALKDLTPKQIQTFLQNDELVSNIGRVAMAFRYPDIDFNNQEVAINYKHYINFATRFVENNKEIKQCKFIDVVQVVKLNTSEVSPLIIGHQIVSTIDDLQNLKSLFELSSFCHKFYIVVDVDLKSEAMKQVKAQDLTVGVITITKDGIINIGLESHYTMVSEHNELQVLREGITQNI